MDSGWRQVNSISTFDGADVKVEKQSLPPMPKELLDLFEMDELKKYMTTDELANHGGAK
jgi:succinate dehydrogenase / fumarate reductase flavoprotein subunit